MKLLSSWRRGEVYLQEINGKKVATKIAKDKEKVGAIKKEIQIITKLNELGILFVPQLISSNEDSFSYEFIEGLHFEDVYEEVSNGQKIELVFKLLHNAFILDYQEIEHGELSKPTKNILVDKSWDIFIIDFERWSFNNSISKNLKWLAQWLHNNNYINLQQLKWLQWKNEATLVYQYLLDSISSNWIRISNQKFRNFFMISWFALLFLWLDLLSKYFFYDLSIFEKSALITPLLNKGAAFGLTIPQWLPFIVFIWFLFIILSHFRNIKYFNILFWLFLAGWAWNLLDRVVYGWVRDFIDLQIWPVFNFADIYLCVFVVWIILAEFLNTKHKK